MTDPTSWIPETIENVAFRLARADECAYEIGDLISAWSLHGPVQVYQTCEDRIVTTRIESIRPIPPKISMLFSEAVSHIRASIDNVVWDLVKDEANGLTSYAQRLVEFPITNDSEHFTKWSRKRVNNGFKIFREGSPLSQRLMSLQPWSDTNSTIPSTSLALAEMRGKPIEEAQALTLLQAYSNNDKHRAAQLAVHNAVITVSDIPIWNQDLSMRRLEPGMILTKAELGVTSVLELNPAAVLNRPAPFGDAVNPSKEIARLRKYVGDTVIPILLRGLASAYRMPPEIDLLDSGATHRERLQQAGWCDALERLSPLIANRFGEAMSADVEVASIRPSE